MFYTKPLSNAKSVNIALTVQEQIERYRDVYAAVQKNPSRVEVKASGGGRAKQDIGLGLDCFRLGLSLHLGLGVGLGLDLGSGLCLDLG